MKSGDQKLKESTSVIEALRIELTDLNQDDFAEACGIPVRTYRRWIHGETKTRPSVPQLKKLCALLKIEKVCEIPDDFSEKYGQK